MIAAIRAGSLTKATNATNALPFVAPDLSRFRRSEPFIAFVALVARRSREAPSMRRLR